MLTLKASVVVLTLLEDIICGSSSKAKAEFFIEGEICIFKQKIHCDIENIYNNIQCCEKEFSPFMTCFFLFFLQICHIYMFQIMNDFIRSVTDWMLLPA